MQAHNKCANGAQYVFEEVYESRVKLQGSEGRANLYFVIMLHPKYKLIHTNNTIVIDRHLPPDSDIEEEEERTPHPRLAPTPQHPHSLLTSVTLRNRTPPIPKQIRLKREAVVISEDEESQSVVFVQKITNEECFKKHLRRLATVPNRVKLERRDETTVECSICLTDLASCEEREIGRLPCRHTFCFSCIFESSKFSNKCPYCRATFRFISHGGKKVEVAEVQAERWDDPMEEPCYVCGRNDDFERLLECEYCEYAYCHTYCDVRLNSDVPPANEWFCLSCEELLRNQHPPVELDQIYEDSS